jgi:hypothetical protein
MTIRPFDWRDIQSLYRFRHQSVFLYSALLLTRGPMVVPGALLSYLAPSTGIFTATRKRTRRSEPPLIGQMIQLSGSQFAHLTFITPDTALNDAPLGDLIDYLAVQAAERGAFRLLADVDEGNPGYEALRKASFAIYARQRIWQLAGQAIGESVGNGWQVATDRDSIGIRSLYNNLVPGLVQQVEPISPSNPRGLVYYESDNLLAYVELKYGHRGVWAQPFIHPDAEEASSWMVSLLNELPYRHSRPVYLCIRSYQSWLESALEDLGAEAGPRQAVMVKHLAVPQKAFRSFALPVLEGGQPEATAPIAHVEQNS